MIGFVSINKNPCILAYKLDNIFIFIAVYVNHLMLESQSQDKLD